MQLGQVECSERVQVRNDNDVIQIRQNARLVARAIGLGLVEQAKIVAAIGAIGRALLDAGCMPSFVVQSSGTGAQPILEVQCIHQAADTRFKMYDFEQTLQLPEMRYLVDEMVVAQEGTAIMLTMRVRPMHSRT